MSTLMELQKVLEERGTATDRVAKVKGHATDVMYREGQVR